MSVHARLTGFLILCLVLIGLNIVATVNGLYDTDNDRQNMLSLSR